MGLIYSRGMFLFLGDILKEIFTLIIIGKILLEYNIFYH